MVARCSTALPEAIAVDFVNCGVVALPSVRVGLLVLLGVNNVIGFIDPPCCCWWVGVDIDVDTSVMIRGGGGGGSRRPEDGVGGIRGGIVVVITIASR